ncbi:MAG: glutamine-hydrolyzing carbamoyl-phosphate synthase small subunit [Aquiluna sp.]|nr:glutamine-hydrolyzing carbamoyl-phosphate synthase small subunit [Aquiluna sp.]
MNKAYLVLEDGTIFDGQCYGATGQTLGELVFTTGMTGYQETLTDPSYSGQIVIQTFPHIGIVGTNQTDSESDKVWVAGYVVKEPSRISSNYRSEKPLTELLIEGGIIGISNIDTRALTLHIRSLGSMRAGIFSGSDLPDRAAMLEIVKASSQMTGQSLSSKVTTSARYTIPATGTLNGRVAVLDLGIKRSTLEHLAGRGLEIEVFPADSSADTILASQPDGYFFSNGPGDPEASGNQVQMLKELLATGKPFFGICFGNQLLGRALGFETYKLKFGHRGINQPVLNVAQKTVEVTAHNHGFAVKLESESAESPAGFGRVRVSHRGLNDNVVEGLECEDIPAFSVQYHPEAAAGPHDSHYLFDKFLKAIQETK